MATTDGEGSGGRTGPARPVALVSLIPAKPSLIRQKKGYFQLSADGKQNVLIRPFQRHILCRVTWSMPEIKKRLIYPQFQAFSDVQNQTKLLGYKETN
jgi:hypothetical protein